MALQPVALQPVIILYPSATCMSIALRCALLSCTRQHQRRWIQYSTRLAMRALYDLRTNAAGVAHGRL